MISVASIKALSALTGLTGSRISYETRLERETLGVKRGLKLGACH